MIPLLFFFYFLFLLFFTITYEIILPVGSGVSRIKKIRRGGMSSTSNTSCTTSSSKSCNISSRKNISSITNISSSSSNSVIIIVVIRVSEEVVVLITAMYTDKIEFPREKGILINSCKRLVTMRIPLFAHVQDHGPSSTDAIP